MVTPDHALLESMFRLNGKTALIVGGYGGIGRVTSALFAALGASLVIAGRSKESADELAGTLGASANSDGRRVLGAQVDITDPQSADELLALVVRELGGLDIMVNMAAVDVTAKAEELEEEDWRQALDVNLSGAFWLSRAAGRVMIEAGQGGRLVHVSSTRSVAGGRRGFAAYAASKGGLNALVRQLATEWGPHQITVNGVAPGFVPTPRSGVAQEATKDLSFVAMLRERIPMQRFPEPTEIAGAVAFLASPASSFITGQILFADGGVTASS